jgi:hypothetical protein
MNTPEAPQAVPQTSPSQQYLLVSLAALAVILLVLLHWGMERWSLLPVLMGALGVTLRWRITPLLTLILLAGLLLAGETTARPILTIYQARELSLADWLLCGAVLALCVAQYRLQGLGVSIFPVEDSRRCHGVADRPVGDPTQRPKTSWTRRSPRLVSPLEIGWLVLSLPIWAFLAQLCWRLAPVGVRAYGFTRAGWRGIVLLWLIGIGVLVVAGFLSYGSQWRLRKPEARLFLQDAFWQETGREQRRICGALARAGLRRRRKEKP